MSCYHPMHMYQVGTKENGKSVLRVLQEPYLGLDEEGKPTTIESAVVDSGQMIPCGKCIGCRQDQSKEWASRLMMEMQYHDSAYFVTLTYNDENVPMVYDEETGEFNGFMTLEKYHCQKFMKDLRKRFPCDKIRFYLAGEYGERSLRPHYHLILFGLHLPPDQLKPFGRSETGNQYYRCPVIEKIWNKGFVSVEPANYATCKYVTAYVTKKLGNKPNEVYTEYGMLPPFSLCSRMPGIASKYYEDHPDIMDKNRIILGTAAGSSEFKIPRYFRKKENNEEARAARARQGERKAEDIDDAMTEVTSLGKLEYRKECEERHKRNVRSRSKL